MVKTNFNCKSIRRLRFGCWACTCMNYTYLLTDTVHVVCHRVCVTIRCPSVRLSVLSCGIRRVCCCGPGGRGISIVSSGQLRPATAAPQHGAQQRMQAVPRLKSTWEAEHRLVYWTIRHVRGGFAASGRVDSSLGTPAWRQRCRSVDWLSQTGAPRQPA